jgi:ABC-2 type transport system ATP-binding protein
VAIIDQGKIIQNTSVRELLKQLNKETFILDLKQKISSCPEVNGYPLTMLDSTTLEVSVEKGKSLNGLFQALTDQGLYVVSLRNKVNRLEELFLDMVEKNLTTGEADNGGANNG